MSGTPRPVTPGVERWRLPAVPGSRPSPPLLDRDRRGRPWAVLILLRTRRLPAGGLAVEGDSVVALETVLASEEHGALGGFVGDADGPVVVRPGH